jgi:hypothetical protein
MINTKPQQSSDPASLAELLHRLEQLERSMLQTAEKKNQPQTYHITIEHLEIHSPRLDSLTFSLDALDIQELSGVLNLGNNFGAETKANPSAAAKAGDKLQEGLQEPKPKPKPKPKLRRNVPVSIIPAIRT